MKIILAIFLALCAASNHNSSGAEADAISAAAAKNEIGNLMVLGDSIASGYGLAGYESGDDYSAEGSFANMLGKSARSYENFAVDGMRSDELLSLLETPTEELRKALESSDTVIVSIGGNDILKPMLNAIRSQALTDTRIIHAILNRDFTPDMITEYSNKILQAAISAAEAVDIDKTVSNIAAITERIRAASPETKLILLTVYDPFMGNVLMRAASEVAEQKLPLLNGGIEALENDKTMIVDVYKAFKGHESEYTNINKLDIHPSAAGHQIIYNLIAAGE